MIRMVLLLAVMAAPASAQSRDEVFRGLWAMVNGTVAANTYSQPTSVSSSQFWTCQTCAPGQRILIGWYDWAYTYDTQDRGTVLRRIAGACQFDPCTTQPYAAHAFDGLIQSGTHRRGPSARTFLIVGDRLWSLYAQGAPSVEAAITRTQRAETALLPLILAATP